MTILYNSIKALFFIFFISKSLACFHFNEDYDPNKYAVILDAYVAINDYTSAREFYFNTMNVLEKHINSQNDYIEHQRILYQSINLQIRMYEHAKDLFLYDSDMYDPRVAEVKILLDESKYFFLQIKDRYQSYLDSDNNKLNNIRFPDLFKDQKNELMEKKERLTRNFEAIFHNF